MIQNIQSFVFPAAFALLPGVMDTPSARAALLTIGLQESRFEHRAQVGGPAHGFWQFEKGGVTGVLEHPVSRAYALQVCHELLYLATPAAVYTAIEHNDVLACCFARLLLWTLPGVLAARGGGVDLAWQQYVESWRPGKPHRDSWGAYFEQAWGMVQHG